MHVSRHLKAVRAAAWQAGQPNEVELFFLADTSTQEQQTLRMSVSVTDGAAAWRLEEVKRPEGSPFSDEQYFDLCYDALCKRHPRGTYIFKYRVMVTRLEVNFAFPIDEPGGSDMLSINLRLTPAPDPHATIRALLSISFREMALNMDLYEQNKAEMMHLRAQFQVSQNTLKTHVESNKDKERELFTKFTLLLNSKSDKLRELRDQNEAYLEEITRLKPVQQQDESGMENDEQYEQEEQQLLAGGGAEWGQGAASEQEVQELKDRVRQLEQELEGARQGQMQ